MAARLRKPDNTYVSALTLARGMNLIPTGTQATTGATNAYGMAPFAGKLAAAYFSAVDALAQHGSNYVTFTITNLGQAGAGTAAMLKTDDLNTTKTTTGVAIVANGKFTLVLTATASDLVVAAGDRIKVTITATGTLANTLTFPVFGLVFERTA
jgi:hypothetical protein